MNNYSFFCYGHGNILATHAKTFEFTKDSELSLEGDCIIGLKADFSLIKLKKFLDGKEKINIIVSCDGIEDNMECNVNKKFNSAHEIVFRKSEFISSRTLGVRCDKGASDIDRELIEKMKNPENKIEVKFLEAE